MARMTTNDDRDSLVAQDESHNHPLRGWARAFAVSGLALALALASLGQTAISVALPQIISDLHGLDGFTWVLSGYLAAETVMIPLVGVLLSRLGSKFVLIAGIVIFLIGSFFAGAAPTIGQLIVFRALQGIGAGSIMGTTFNLLRSQFSQFKRPGWQALFVFIFALSSIVGPTVGT